MPDPDADQRPSRPHQTRVLRVQSDLLGEGDRDRVREAAALLSNGATVAFPTETVYGLGANGTDPEAVRRIFEAKGRPSDNPLILHVASAQDVAGLVRTIPARARHLMERFWPGPLTLVLDRGPAVPEATTAGLDTVAVRCPAHPVAHGLLEAAGVPVAAPSANRSGRPSPTRATHVLADLDGRIDAVLDGGATGVGVESTVLDLTSDPPRVLRPGGVSLEALAEVLPAVEPPAPGTVDEQAAPRSPGLKYRHYAPTADLVLVMGATEGRWDQPTLEAVLERARTLEDEGRAVGWLVSEATAARLTDGPTGPVAALGSNADEAARRLFHGLRSLDDRVDVILAEPWTESGVGRAVLDRLRRAAHRVERIG